MVFDLGCKILFFVDFMRRWLSLGKVVVIKFVGSGFDSCFVNILSSLVVIYIYVRIGILCVIFG